ncbi:Two-component response regulator Orr4 [Dionaea muscipula]
MEFVEKEQLQINNCSQQQQQERRCQPPPPPLEVRGGGDLVKEEEQNFHVLAVDDSSIDRKILEKLLSVSSSNYQVTLLESGDEALEYLGLTADSNPHHNSAHSTDQMDLQQGNGIRVNLIMTDYSMPGMSGYDLLKRVKGSSWKDVPVVVMSSENVPSRINMCMEEGAEEFLLKPVRMSDLKRLKAYLLKSSSSTNINSADSNANEPDEGIKNHHDARSRTNLELEGVAGAVL